MDHVIQTALAGLHTVDAVTVNTYKGAGGTQLRAYLKDRGAFICVVSQQSEAVNALLSRQTTRLEIIALTEEQASALLRETLTALCGTRGNPGRYSHQTTTPAPLDIGWGIELTVARTVTERGNT